MSIDTPVNPSDLVVLRTAAALEAAIDHDFLAGLPD